MLFWPRCFRALVLIGVAAVCCAAFNPHMTKPSVASKLVEINNINDAFPPQWVPVLLASSFSHVDSPAPRFDEEELSMERRMAEIDPDCGSEESLMAVWACHLKCMNAHDFDAKTETYKKPGLANCKKECPTLCSPPPSPPPRFDCTSTKKRWSADKSKWCCHNEERGCAPPPPPQLPSPSPPQSPPPSPPSPPSPLPPPPSTSPPPSPSPPPPLLCWDKDPAFCKAQVISTLDRITKCKQARFTANCRQTCVVCTL
jgi:hypothetical protein